MEYDRYGQNSNSGHEYIPFSPMLIEFDKSKREEE